MPKESTNALFSPLTGTETNPTHVYETDHRVTEHSSVQFNSIQSNPMTDNNTIEIDRERYDEFMSTLDGILDGIADNGYDEQIFRLDAIRDEMELHRQTEQSERTDNE